MLGIFPLCGAFLLHMGILTWYGHSPLAWGIITLHGHSHLACTFSPHVRHFHLAWGIFTSNGCSHLVLTSHLMWGIFISFITSHAPTMHWRHLTCSPPLPLHKVISHTPYHSSKHLTSCAPHMLLSMQKKYCHLTWKYFQNSEEVTLIKSIRYLCEPPYICCKATKMPAISSNPPSLTYFSFWVWILLNLIKHAVLCECRNYEGISQNNTKGIWYFVSR